MMSWADTAKIDVNVPDKSTLLEIVRTCFTEKTGFSIATLNLDHVVKLRRDPAFASAYGQHSHVTADGNPIVWLSRLARQDVSLIPGSELIEPITMLAAQEGVPVGFLGSTRASLDAAADALRARYPTLDIASVIAPEMGFDPTGDSAKAAITQMQARGVRLVFLALGAPKQEIFAAFAQKQMPQTGFLSIGAGLDFISGKQVRAPKWVRAIAAEWIWRLALSPARLARRYGACLAILPSLTWRALRARTQGRVAL